MYKAQYVNFSDLPPQCAGPRWGGASDDMNFTILSWPEGHGIAWSVNKEVDVVLVVLEGEGEARVEDESFELSAGCIIVIPKGAHRSIICRSKCLTYLSAHRRRNGLQVQTS